LLLEIDGPDPYKRCEKSPAHVARTLLTLPMPFICFLIW
jgi:hypothetical protein